MAEVIWTLSASACLVDIHESLALHDPIAARNLSQKILSRVRQLEQFPHSGSRIPEWPGLSNRQVIIRPYRVFYRIVRDQVHILYIARPGQIFYPDLLS